MRLAIWGLLWMDAEREGRPEKIVERCKESGIETYLAYVNPMEKCSAGEIPEFAYHSTAFQGTPRDLLSPLLKAAKREGLEVEPWLLPFRPHLMHGETTEGVFQRSCKSLSSVFALDPSGYSDRLGRRLCPSWPENRARGMRMLNDYIENHGDDLTGIHLDYTRYADFAPNGFGGLCHCDACRRLYDRFIGKDFLTLEDFGAPGIVCRVLQIRNRCIREMVEEMRDITRRAGLRLTLAARALLWEYAVPEGQNWPQWVNDGLLDRVYVMNYAGNTEMEPAWTHCKRVETHAAVLKHRGEVLHYDGINRKSGGGEHPMERLAEFAEEARNAGADGISIFDYNAMTDDDFQTLKSWSL